MRQSRITSLPQVLGSNSRVRQIRHFFDAITLARNREHVGLKVGICFNERVFDDAGRQGHRLVKFTEDLRTFDRVIGVPRDLEIVFGREPRTASMLVPCMPGQSAGSRDIRHGPRSSIGTDCARCPCNSLASPFRIGAKAHARSSHTPFRRRIAAIHGRPLRAGTSLATRTEPRRSSRTHQHVRPRPEQASRTAR